jgi:hypothetical protein
MQWKFSPHTYCVSCSNVYIYYFSYKNAHCCYRMSVHDRRCIVSLHFTLAVRAASLLPTIVDCRI